MTHPDQRSDRVMAKRKINVRRTKPDDIHKVVFLGDVHAPYHDPVAMGLVFDFLRWFKPDFVYLIGDWIDFYQLSRFDKDPQRILGLQDEIDQCRELMAKTREACPNAWLYFREGNHEHRLTRYLCAHPEIASLRSLQLPVLLDFQQLEIDYCPYNGDLDHYGFLVEHGDVARKHSGYTAKAMLDKRGISGITGHTHRLGAHYVTDAAGDKVWYENGCLCHTNPEYILGRPNWQQGFSVLHNWDDRFQVEQICMHNHRIFYNGYLWEQERRGRPPKN
jgi:predicted phosphodiesterase